MTYVMKPEDDFLPSGKTHLKYEIQSLFRRFLHPRTPNNRVVAMAFVEGQLHIGFSGEEALFTYPMQVGENPGDDPEYATLWYAHHQIVMYIAGPFGPTYV